MEKEKQSARPQEVECPRPDLYVIMCIPVYNHDQKPARPSLPTDGIWLRKGSGKVCVKTDTLNPYPQYKGDGPVPVGAFYDGSPTGPKYTGPIDDETMANILIYG